MVKLRLTRMGAAKQPAYRIVAADSRARRDGRFIEILGYYNPLTNPAEVKVDEEKAKIAEAEAAKKAAKADKSEKRSKLFAKKAEEAPAAAATSEETK